MPPQVTSSAPARTANKSAGLKPQTHDATQRKKTRVVRRRGRAKGVVDSDDEIEREARTDSESEDDISSLGSGSESESEDIITNGSPHPRTPSTSQSPQEAPPIAKDPLGPESFFGSTGNWSEMVADETMNGPADLPVIDFSELNDHVVQVHPPTRKSKKIPKKDPSVAKPAPVQRASVDEVVGDQSEETPASTPHGRPNRSFPRRPPGQSARQAYQARLESDPSYVPTVGEFWGHDDRLLDKNLRSLSNWWRGRWQGRGRGRGFPRGKGPMMGRGLTAKVDQVDETGQEGAQSPELPPVERAWTHDGFEEMKRNEERRRAQQAASQQPARGAAPNARGRGGFPHRGRGGRAGFNSSMRSHSPSGGSRVWYVMKPERMWTKQSELFLYLDPALKPRPGQAAGIRVKLPGEHSQATKLPMKESASMPSPKPAVTSTTSLSGSDYGGNKGIIVRLPKLTGKERESQAPSNTDSKDEPSLDDVFTVRPRLVSPKPIPLPDPSSSMAATNLPNGSNELPSLTFQPTLDPMAQQKLEQVSVQPQSSDPQRWAQTEEAVLRNPSGEANHVVPNTNNDGRPDLPPIQTSFTPPNPQGSPAYGSPYTFPPPLPPGIAINSMGMPYELATGRPVYLPPPTMYDPRPMMAPPSAPFVPGHVHHRSLSDFSAQPSPPPPQPVNGFIDYNTGQTFFSFPRQSSRIQIRSPDGRPQTVKPSGLRSSAVAFEPTRTEDGFFSAPLVNRDSNEEDTPREEPSQPDQHQVAAYNPYEQQYYYPDAYAYNPYMDMSQMGQYGMYPQDHIPQGTVYY